LRSDIQTSIWKRPVRIACRSAGPLRFLAPNGCCSAQTLLSVGETMCFSRGTKSTCLTSPKMIQRTSWVGTRPEFLIFTRLRKRDDLLLRSQLEMPADHGPGIPRDADSRNGKSLSAHLASGRQGYRYYRVPV